MFVNHDKQKLLLNKHNYLKHILHFNKIKEYNNNIIKYIDSKINYKTKDERDIRDTIVHVLLGNYEYIWKKINPLYNNNNNIIINENKNEDKIIYKNCIYCDQKWSLPIIHLLLECKVIIGLIDNNQRSILLRRDLDSLIYLINILKDNNLKYKF